MENRLCWRLKAPIAGRAIIDSALLRHLLTAAAHIASKASRVAQHEAVIRHVPGDDSACGDQGKAADLDARQDNGAGADRGAVLDQGTPDFPIIGGFQAAIGRNRPRGAIVGQAGLRADKHAILDCSAVIEQCPVLNLNAAADVDVEIDIDIFADDTVIADNGAFANLDEVPDVCPGADVGVR